MLIFLVPFIEDDSLFENMGLAMCGTTPMFLLAVQQIRTEKKLEKLDGCSFSTDTFGYTSCDDKNTFKYFSLACFPAEPSSLLVQLSRLRPLGMLTLSVGLAGGISF